MMKYITIDGDDIGRRITSYYLNENEAGLERISYDLTLAVENISNLLTASGFEVIFCAADGVLAKTSLDINYELLFSQIQLCATHNITFSAGVGGSLKSAYIALMDAKSSGKNQIKMH
ncbi:mCpol domain-containing protein [Vibrio parahaemolyticus]